LILAPADDANLEVVLAMGCWTPCEFTGNDSGWSVSNAADDGSRFEVCWDGASHGSVEWELLGAHNVSNALAAIGAARHAGVPAAQAVEALCRFKNVKRRMELRGEINGIRVYDDFAHHPTAIATTLGGLRNNVGSARILAVLEPRSNTMRMGVHKDTLLPSLADADRVFIYTPRELGWGLPDNAANSVTACEDFEQLLSAVIAEAKPGDHILVMSNGGFGGIHGKLLERLKVG
jgi:UDP-N-acetylmuramate: L-alanyl-gamma-D-glutamyl-meso-diaminopimelate ligase